MSAAGTIGWVGIVRLGLVQTALGAIVVLTTSTLNRVMVVELGLLAMVPGALVAIHYAVQTLRPRWGYGSDIGGRRTPWIIGGMAVLALGGAGAAASTMLMATSPALGLAVAVLAFLTVGVGVGAAGTSLLVLLATHVASGRRAAAATIVWLMMIAGFVATTIIVGQLIEPFSYARLVLVCSGVCTVAFLVTVLAVAGLEGRGRIVDHGREGKPPFRRAMAEVWREATARRFAVFVFVSMLAYSAQDLILEPFAGLVFGFTPGESTQLSGTHHGGVFLGMVLVGVVCTALGGLKVGSMRTWVVGGCVASALAMAGLAIGGSFAETWPLRLNVFLLGASNGAFAVAAIGSMMALASAGREGREGTRMGLFGAAQGIAFGLGGFLGTVAVDAMRAIVAAPELAYGLVFAVEGVLFLVAALLAARIGKTAVDAERLKATTLGDGVMAGVAGN
jgi:BCD family chlorophyll transporter-like MFS transporter